MAFLRFKRLSFSHSVLPIYNKESNFSFSLVPVENIYICRMIFFQEVQNKQRMILSAPTWMDFPISFFWYITAFLRQLIAVREQIFFSCTGILCRIVQTADLVFVLPGALSYQSESIFNYIITWQSSSILYQSFFHIQQIINALNSTRLKVTMHGQFDWNQRIHIKCIMAALWQLYVTTLTRIT